MKHRIQVKIVRALCVLGIVSTSLFGATSVKAADPVEPKENGSCTKLGDMTRLGLFCDTVKGKKIWTNPVLPAGTYKIGLPAVTSGALALVGTSSARGTRLAVEQMNKIGFLGKGVKIELIETDTGSTNDKTIAAINQMSAAGVSGIVCCLLSGMSGAAKTIATSLKLPMAIDVGLLPSLPDGQYIYRPQIMLAKPGGTYSKMVDTLIKAYKLKTVVMVQTADNAAVAGEALIWKAAVVASGAAVLSTIDTLSADTDFSGAASQAISQKSDAVFISMNGAVGARFVRALRERGYQGIVAAGFSISDTTLFSLAGSTLDKTIFPTPFFYGDPKSTEASNIFKLYKKKYGEEMAVFGGQGYSAAKLILSAMKISKTGSAADVTKALKRITRLETIYGPMVFSGGQGDYAISQEATLAVWDSKGGQTKWVAPKK